MKNNWFNRIFRPKKLEEYNNHCKLLRRIIGWYPLLIQDLEEAETLDELLEVHKKAWEIGYRNNNLEPCEYGMFRTESIPDMTIDEVYLGGIWGLNTKNIRFWNEHCTDAIGANGYDIDEKRPIYDLIKQQYRILLSKNFRELRSNALNELYSYED